MDTQNYLKVSIKLANWSSEFSDIIVAMISDLGFDSFMEEPPVLQAYIQNDLFDRDAFAQALEGLDGVSWSCEAMPVANWNQTWESEGFTPIVLGGDVAVHAFGSSVEVPTRFDIVLNPQMAFGTGHHDTTHMMLESMVECETMIRGREVIDLGCGTAVLAILAAKLGASKVMAIDIDATAARSAEANVALNGVDIEVACGDASALKSCDVLLANIHKNIIINDLSTYAKSVRPGGLLLVSGFYPSDADGIIAAASSAGFSIEGSRTQNGWACLKFVRS